MLRTFQLIGFLLAVAGLTLGYVLLSPIEGETSEAAAGAAGLGILFMMLPMLGWSALLLIPSSAALFSQQVRERSYIKGQFWLTLWRVNLFISALYISVVLYLGYLRLSISLTH